MDHIPKRLHKILVTGARSIREYHAPLIRQVLAQATHRALEADMRVQVLEGRCPYGGVDLIAQRWCEGARKRGLDVVNIGYPANWDTEGLHAGPARNQRMVDAGPDVCLAFPTRESRGTWDCVRKATDAGIRTYIYPLLPLHEMKEIKL